VAAYARLEVPGQAAVAGAVETLEGWAVAVHERVKADRARRVLSGMDDARFQRELERAALRRLHDAPGREQGQVPAVDDQPEEESC
jgi:hypothetical protein